jgi:hypothetical protein
MLVNGIPITIAQCTDGTSNTMILGEISNWAYDAAGTRRHIDPSWPHGWAMGSSNPNIVNTVIATGLHERFFNLVTVRYPVGTKNYLLPGVNDNHGVNNPLTSAHPGGAQIALTDGSVRFLPDTTDLQTLKALADRDDNLSIGEY